MDSRHPTSTAAARPTTPHRPARLLRFDAPQHHVRRPLFLSVVRRDPPASGDEPDQAT